MSRKFRFDSPSAAVKALVGDLLPVGTEQVPWDRSQGLVLAQAIVADRDSPPCDVSAMDGYAVRVDDLDRGTLPIAGTASIGRAAPPLPAGTALRVVTGAPVPPGAQVIVPREQTTEEPDRVRLRVGPDAIRAGQHIRRRGENLPAGGEVVPAGTVITAAVTSSLAAFGIVRPRVYRKVRVAILTSGDELMDVESRPEPWQIRDSNGPVLQALVSHCPRLELADCRRVPDSRQELEWQVRDLVNQCDALLLTGGVSMGDCDYVPAVVEASGARVIFHGLPIRPGKPLLAARGPQGQLILGLPGNPLSVLTCACRVAAPALARRSGLRQGLATPLVTLAGDDERQMDLWWYRPVVLRADGGAWPVPSRGSADIVSAARSHGFIEIPPRSKGTGPWSFYRWEL